MKIECGFIKDKLFGADTFRGIIKIWEENTMIFERIYNDHRLSRTLAFKDAVSMKTKETIKEEMKI